MATSPYRSPAILEEPSRDAPPASFDVGSIGAFVWLTTVARVGIGLLRAEATSRELALAWVILLLLPWMIRQSAKRART